MIARLCSIFIFILFTVSCRSQKVQSPAGAFKIMTKGLDFESASDEDIEEQWKVSTSYLLLDEKTGDYEGSLAGQAFKGSYDFGRISSGYAKGISIRVTLGYFQVGDLKQNELKNLKLRLVNARSLYFHNDQLMNGKWDFLEIKCKEGEKVMLVRKRFSS